MRRLLERDPHLWFSVSATTRSRRDGEVDGKDYCSSTGEEFERIRDEGGFLEWFDVYGDLKGTPRAPVEEHLAAGDDVLLEVDVQGALAVRETFPDAVLVFVKAAVAGGAAAPARSSEDEDDPGGDRAPPRPGRGGGGRPPTVSTPWS